MMNSLVSLIAKMVAYDKLTLNCLLMLNKGVICILRYIEWSYHFCNIRRCPDNQGNFGLHTSSCICYVSRGVPLFDKNVGIEAGQILSNQRPVFPNTNTSRLIINQPTAN